MQTTWSSENTTLATMWTKPRRSHRPPAGGARRRAPQTTHANTRMQRPLEASQTVGSQTAIG